MQWNTGKLPEYEETPSTTNYYDPSYYRQTGAEAHLSAQSAQSLPAYPNYAEDSAYEDEAPPVVRYYQPELSAPYRGPSSMEGYTLDPGAEQREAAKRGTAESGNKKKLASLGGVGAMIAALLLKIKTVLVILLDIKWLAFAFKFGWAGISAFISIVLYSYIFGWPFAIGLVALLFIHEMGHAVVMKLKGIPVGGMIFIPMLGAAVLMRQMPKNAKDEAEVGIAGPIAGALAASVCLFLALQTPHPNPIWAPLAYFGFFLNLFNLMPIVPFDGGRVLAAIDRRIWILGFLGLVGYEVWATINGNFSIWLVFFIIMAGTQFWTRHTVANTPEKKAYYTVPVGERIILSLVYFGLAAVLVLGMSISHNLILSLLQ